MRIRARALLVLGVLAFSTGVVPRANADPVTVTSGQLVLPWDDPSYFSFLGIGLALSSGFIYTPSSPWRTCLSGCRPGTVLDMSALAGGASPFTRFPLGVSFQQSSTGSTTSPLTARGYGWPGELRFTAPHIVLPPLADVTFARLFTAPFELNGFVTAFAFDDAEARNPLFEDLARRQGNSDRGI